jgi:hypothetical protein
MNTVEESLVRSRRSVGSETEKEREQRYRMHSVGASSEGERERAMNTDSRMHSAEENLLQSRHSFGRETVTAS